MSDLLSAKVVQSVEKAGFETAPPEAGDDLALLRGPGLRPTVMEEFLRHTGSPMVGVFAAVLFDQITVMPIAASVDHTSRFRDNFLQRAFQSLFGLAPVLVGEPAQRKAAGEWLKDRHRVVRGSGTGEFEGVRYSALDPELWLWIAASGINHIMATFTFCTGERLTAAESEAAYQFLRRMFAELELPSAKGKLPATLTEFTEYYEHMVTTKMHTNGLVRDLFSGLTRLPLPTLFLPAALRTALSPAWFIARPFLGRMIQICSAKAMHPELVKLMGFELKARHNPEFALYVALLQAVWYFVPDRLLLEPVTYNTVKLNRLRSQLDGSRRAQHRYVRAQQRTRRQNDKVLGFYREHRLEDFSVPESRSATCPFAS